MSRPLGAKVPYHHTGSHRPVMLVSTARIDTNAVTNRSSWYYNDNDDDDDNDKNDDLSSSSYSSSVAKENLAVPCWGGWLLKLTTQRQPPQLANRRKPALKVIASSSCTTSDDSEIGHDDDDDDHASSCSSRSMTPPCPPTVSFPTHHGEGDEDLSDDMQMIRALQVEGDRFEHQGLLLDALNIYQRLLELHRATGQSANQIGKVHYRTGMIQFKRHYYNEALCHFDQALFIYQLNYDPDNDVCDYDDDYDETTTTAMKNDCDDMALDFYRVYVATGHVHLTNQNPYRAIDYFHRALQFVKPEPVSLSSSSSAPLLRSKKAFLKRQTYDPYYAQVLQALGTAYEAVGDETEAKLHYQNAAAVTSTTNI